MTRRNFLGAAVAGAGAYLALEPAALQAQNPPPAVKSPLGVNQYSFHYRQIKSAYDFLEYCHGLGAAGIQYQLDSLDAAYIAKLRRRTEEWGMYFEAIGELPKADTAQFEATIVAARNAGALCLRTACLSGRRYENFSSLDEWNGFVTESKARIARAVPIVEKHRLPMAIENHGLSVPPRVALETGP